MLHPRTVFYVQNIVLDFDLVLFDILGPIIKAFWLETTHFGENCDVLGLIGGQI